MDNLTVLKIIPNDSEPKSFIVSTDFIKAVTEIPALFQRSAYKFKSSPEYFTRVYEVIFTSIPEMSFHDYTLEDKCKTLIIETFSYNKSYIIVLTTDMNQVMIQFDSLRYLNGILNTLYWLGKIHSIDCILNAKTFRRGKIRIKDSDNDINRDKRLKAIKSDLSDLSKLSSVNFIDDLIDIVIDYIKGLCGHIDQNNVVECRNYHENTDINQIIDNVIVTYNARCDMCYNKTKFPIINAELIF